jgi:beta-1,4-mannosyl-glycoprotein beta-1,4-N-acetylglucosaminyltransferase
MEKKIDCITFFDEGFIFDFRYNILKNVVDQFIVCESIYDHKGKKKKINFNLKKYKNKNKIKHIILKKKFPKTYNEWERQALQREYILENLDNVDPDDYIFFSDPDEIPNPNLLKKFKLQKKYGIFLQRYYSYQFNLLNKFETPWEGTKVCKKKNLESIQFMRQKVRAKNLRYNFLRFDKEKNIQLFKNGGWHFNNVMSPIKISKKLKTYAHNEYKDNKFSSPKVIKKKIQNKIDLFERGERYQLVKINKSFPEYLLKNKKKFKKFIRV